MKICDINPFIRYSSIDDFRPVNDFVRSYDSRLFYIVEGNCKIIIEGKEYNVKEDTFMLWQPGTAYCFKMYSNIKMIVLNFDYTQNNNEISKSIAPVSSNNFDKKLITECHKFENCEHFNQPLVLENMHSVKKQLIKITEKNRDIKLYKSEACSAILKEVLTEIASVSSYSETKALNKIDIVLEYLKDNFDKDITNKDLGKLTGYHSYYINRLMLKHTGVTLRQHLINIRLDAAKEMLTKTDMSIYEITEKCGFNNSAYFSNHFKEKLGMNPSTYRTKFRNVL